MKMLVVTCLEKDEHLVGELFKKAEISVFTAAPATGFRNDHWVFNQEEHPGKETRKFESVFIFSFTTNEKAADVLSLIKKHTHQTQAPHPLRAFVLPVESTSY